jgi:SEC-C motif-containing protein
MSQEISHCPCGSGVAFEQCCAPIIANDNAQDPEQLMRSRYTAFVLGDEAYLLKTWHSSTCPKDFSLGQARWLGLHVLEARGDSVRFEAAFHSGSKGMVLKETSRFVLEEGHWRYVDGDCTVVAIKRNEACFCGSGVKFKRCCGVRT